VPCGHIVIRNNTMVGCDVGVALIGAIQKVHVVGNRFLDLNNMAFDLYDLLLGTADILVANNTLWRCRAALVIRDDHNKGKNFLKCKNIRVHNNLVLDPKQVGDLFFLDHPRGNPNQDSSGDLQALLNSPQWRFSHNEREIDPEKAAARFPGRWIPGPNDHLQVPIKVLSTKRSDADFLKLAKDSPLAKGGVNDGSLPAYVGAVPPEGVEPWDWDKTWKTPPNDIPAQKAGGPPLPDPKVLTVSKKPEDGGRFRTDISKVLREQFVLHWQSVRPVPKVTIDFGDGRKLVRTLTGNSIHYVLDAEAHPIDALPGLYGPKAFRERLESSQQAARSLTAPGKAGLVQRLQSYHANEHARILQRWRDDLKKSGIVLPEPTRANQAVANPAQPAKPPAARAAAVLAISKGKVELPLLDAFAAARAAMADPRVAQPLELATTEEVWKKIAALHAEDAKLDGASVTLIQEHMPTALHAAGVAKGKAEVEIPLLRMVARFQESIALDTVRNEYLMHRRLHQWFLTGEAATRDVEKLNQRVYAELFLTPDSDPWLGLVSDEVYTGLKDHGIVPAATSK